jgi:hypothetical protein
MAISLLAPWTVGQSTFGGIVGVVKDPGQEAVASAQVTLTSLDDRTEHTAYLQQTPTPANTNRYDVRTDRTLTSKQFLFCALELKSLEFAIAN